MNWFLFLRSPLPPSARVPGTIPAISCSFGSCSFWNGEESGELWSSDEDMDVAALALPSPQIMAPGSALNAALEDITCFGTLGDLTSFDHAPGGMGVVSAVGGGAGNGGSGGVLGVGSMVAGVGMNALGRGHGGVMMVHVSGDGELMLDEDKGHRTDPQVFEDMLKVRREQLNASLLQP